MVCEFSPPCGLTNEALCASGPSERLLAFTTKLLSSNSEILHSIYVLKCSIIVYFDIYTKYTNILNIKDGIHYSGKQGEW